MIDKDSGGKALVVQTNGYGRFLGDLTIGFDDSGRVVGWEGIPHKLDDSIPEDPQVADIVYQYHQELDKQVRNPIGYSEVIIDGSRPGCRLRECPFGSFMTDAMAYGLNVSMAIMNSGAIKGSLEGKITTGDIYNVLPFPNNIDLIEIKGSTLRKILELSMEKYDPNHYDPPGNFLQLSGIYVTYDTSLPSNHRIVSLKTGKTLKVATLVEDDKIYKVATSSFLAEGGDGYSMIPRERVSRENLGLLDKDLLTTYIKQNSPLTELPETGRIVIISTSILNASPIHKASVSVFTVLIIFILLCTH